VTVAVEEVLAESSPTEAPKRRWSWARSWKIRVGGAILLFFVLLAIAGPLLAPYNPTATGPDLFAPPSAAHLLGTTSSGQDILSELLVGTRISLLVGFTAAAIGEGLAIIVGITAGFVGGVASEALSMLTNIFLVIPVLPLEILLASYLSGAGWLGITLIISITAWPWGARTLRAQTLSIRKRDYVEAARLAGEPLWRLVLVDILPNEVAIIITGFLFHVLFAIVVQTGLAFLGVGSLTTWSWGTILYWAQNGNAVLTGAWWWFLPPGICLALVGMGLALMNLGLDEVINPKLRGGRARNARASLGRRRGLWARFA